MATPIATGIAMSPTVWMTVPAKPEIDVGEALPIATLPSPPATEQITSVATPKPNHLICCLTTCPPARYRKTSEIPATRRSSPATGSEVNGSSTRAHAALPSGLAGSPIGSDGAGLHATSATETPRKTRTTPASHRQRGEGNLPSGKVSTTKISSPKPTADKEFVPSSSQPARPDAGSAAYI